MSLINDALKRAKQTQPDAAPSADGPELRPHFAPSRSRVGNDWLLPAVIVILLLLASVCLWQWFRTGGAIPVRARTAPETAPTLASTPVAAPVPVHAKLPSDSTVQVKTNLTVEPISTVSNAPVATPVAPAPPPAPTYKLQSIFYRAKSPAAVINGKTLFIGDHVAGAHVTAIDKESVTIVTSQGETKVLELP